MSKKRFQVGIKKDFLHGESNDYPLLVFYPAVKEGSDSGPDEEHAPYPGLVFAHGYMASAQLYANVGKNLGSHGYVTAIFSAGVKEAGVDFRAFLHEISNPVYSREVSKGIPIGTMNPFKAIAQSREAIAKAIDYLSSNPMKIVRTERIGIVGHSLGGMTALQAAASDERLKAVVACSAVNIKMIANKLMGGIGETIAERMMGDGKFATAIKIPTMLVYGTQDKITPFEHGLSYYNMIDEAPKVALAINGAIDPKDKLGLKAHNLGLAIYKRLGNEYTPKVVKCMVNWFNLFLYEERRSWAYVFGDKIRTDLAENVLSRLEMKM